jgi:hypothetical protein
LRSLEYDSVAIVLVLLMHCIVFAVQMSFAFREGYGYIGALTLSPGVWPWCWPFLREDVIRDAGNMVHFLASMFASALIYVALYSIRIEILVPGWLSYDSGFTVYHALRAWLLLLALPVSALILDGVGRACVGAEKFLAAVDNNRPRVPLVRRV